MSVISRLPGGGLGKNNILTSFDIKTISNFGDIIHQNKMSTGDYPYGGIYYEENEDGSGKLFVQCYGSNDSNTYVYVYSIVDNVATQLKKIQVGSLGGSKTFNLNSDKNSNIIVLSDIRDVMYTIYYINKSNYSVKSFNAPTYDGSMLSFMGATVVNGIIYATTYGNLSAPYLYTYSEDGTQLSNFTNDIGVLYANGSVKFDGEGNIYIPFAGNTSNMGSYVMVSITSDGTLRWRKSMTDLGVASGAKLLAVKADGTSIWYLTTNSYSLVTLDKDGNLLTKVDNVYNSTLFYMNRAQFKYSDKYLYIQDFSGDYYYLKDSELNTIHTLELNSTNGRPCVWVEVDKLFVARFDGSFYIEVRKPYNEYTKR